MARYQICFVIICNRSPTVFDSCQLKQVNSGSPALVDQSLPFVNLTNVIINSKRPKQALYWFIHFDINAYKYICHEAKGIPFILLSFQACYNALTQTSVSRICQRFSKIILSIEIIAKSLSRPLNLRINLLSLSSVLSLGDDSHVFQTTANSHQNSVYNRSQLKLYISNNISSTARPPSL